MRIDLEGGRRPVPMRAMLWLVRRVVGIVPGPMLVMSRRPDLMKGPFRRYVMRAMSADGEWSRGETELMAAFVSDLNRCHF